MYDGKKLPTKSQNWLKKDQLFGDRIYATMYPVACSPQAWAATTPLVLLQAALGMSVEGTEGRVRFLRPALPPELERVSIRNLPVGAGSVDVALHRHPEDVGIQVTGRRGRVELVSIK